MLGPETKTMAPLQMFVAEVRWTHELKKFLQYVLSLTFSAEEEIIFKIVDRGFPTPRPAILYDLENGLTPQLPVFLIGGSDMDEACHYWRDCESQVFYAENDLAISDMIDYLTETQTTLDIKFQEKKFPTKKGFTKLDGNVTIGYRLEICNLKPPILAVSLIHYYDYR